MESLEALSGLREFGVEGLGARCVIGHLRPETDSLLVLFILRKVLGVHAMPFEIDDSYHKLFAVLKVQLIYE